MLPRIDINKIYGQRAVALCHSKLILSRKTNQSTAPKIASTKKVSPPLTCGENGFLLLTINCWVISASAKNETEIRAKNTHDG